jgi:hypothetical protein
MTMKAEPVDMSPRAIAQRLDKMRALYELMKYLAQFKPLVDEAEKARRSKG